MATVLVPGLASAKKKDDAPRVISPGDSIAGVSYSRWPVWLLKGFLETPVDYTLLSDLSGGDCGAQTGEVVFFPSVPSGDPVDWTCSIRSDQVVIVTLRDTYTVALPNDSSDKKVRKELRRMAKCSEKAKGIKVRINGNKVKEREFLFVGAQDGDESEEVVTAALPVGTVDVAVKGHYLALTDFPPGEHWISVESEGCSGTGLDDQDLLIELFVTK